MHAEKEAKRAAKRAKLEAKQAAENIGVNVPPVDVAPMTGRVAHLPVAVAVAMPAMPTPIGMPNLARAAAALGVGIDAD